MKKQPLIRQPGVAGTFYPAAAEEIRLLIENSLEKEGDAIDNQSYSGTIQGGIVPHAGMFYCALQAVHFFEHCRRSGQQPDTVVIAHPNHNGYGPAMSTDGHDFWETPLGRVPADRDLAAALDLPVSAEAQEEEHSAEVLLPYLQYFLPEGFSILSVNILCQNYETAVQLAQKVFEASKRLNRDILFLASSDFSHFLSPGEAEPLDDMVLHKILEKDAPGVYHTVNEHKVSVCGYCPIMALMEYAYLCDPEYQVHLMRRGHSGEVSPSHRVVNYMSLLFETLTNKK